MDASIPDTLSQEEAVAIYKRFADDAAASGSEGGRYASVHGVGPAVLANVVVAHAACRWLGLAPDDPKHRRLTALRRDHGVAIFDQIPIAAGAANADPISYLSATLKKAGTTR
jgi:hypothetical protein